LCSTLGDLGNIGEGTSDVGLKIKTLFWFGPQVLPLMPGRVAAISIPASVSSRAIGLATVRLSRTAEYWKPVGGVWGQGKMPKEDEGNPDMTHKVLTILAWEALEPVRCARVRGKKQ